MSKKEKDPMQEVLKLPDTMVLKTGERISREVGNAIMAQLHQLVKQDPFRFFRMARMCRLNYHLALERELRVAFPKSNPAVATTAKVFRSALVLDGDNTRLESPYDIQASYNGSGRLYDQLLFQAAWRITNRLFEIAETFGQYHLREHIIDQCGYDPCTETRFARGLVLELDRELPTTLIGPWGEWEFLKPKNSLHFYYLNDAGQRFWSVVLKQCDYKIVSESRTGIMQVAVKMVDEIVLPDPRIYTADCPWDDYGHYHESGFQRHQKQVWRHQGQYLDPDLYC